MTEKRVSARYSWGVKKSNKSIPLDVKLETLRQFEVGKKLNLISNTLGLNKFTVGILNDTEDKTKASAQASTPLSAMIVICHWSDVMENMEGLLNVKIEGANKQYEHSSQWWKYHYHYFYFRT